MPSESRMQDPTGKPFNVGDRVIVSGGYDLEPDWLKGGNGYVGTIVDFTTNWAVVELEDELILEASGDNTGWPDFGGGNAEQLTALKTARGRWLALAHGWVGQEWREPIGRVHVGLCSQKPDIRRVPDGGGVGAWVESHATMRHLDTADSARDR